jgi:outer membrane protein assembly factor BamB
MKIGCRSLWMIGLACLASSAEAGDWNRFRGPSGNGIAEGEKHPLEWAEDTNVAWKVAIPGRGWSQPIVAGDRIFVTTAISDAEESPRRFDRGVNPDARDSRSDVYQWKVLCLSAQTGNVMWEQVAYEGKPAQPKHRGNTYASETPVTDGERVIAYFGIKGITCYDLDGNPQWSRSLGEFKTQAGWGTASSPVIHGRSVLIQCDNDQSSFLVALDKTNGNELWRMKREEKSNWSTPIIWTNSIRTELVVAGGTKMRSYDPETGKVLWEMAGSGRTSVSPVGDRERLVVDSVSTFQGSPGRLAAIRPGAKGDISLPDDKTLSSDFVPWSLNFNSYRNASPLLYNDCLYMLEQSAGIIRCFNARTGKVHYQQRLPESTGFMASPWVNDNKVYILNDSGVTVALEPGPEFKVLATNRLNEDLFWSSAAFCGDRLLLRGMQHLYCIRE